jgi:hypothetical protein
MKSRQTVLRSRRRGRFTRIGLALALAGGMAGCTSFVSDLPVVGEPAHIPKAPEAPPAFPAVHDMPPARDTKPLTAEERKKLEAELAAARDKQEAETGTAKKPAQ